MLSSDVYDKEKQTILIILKCIFIKEDVVFHPTKFLLEININADTSKATATARMRSSQTALEFRSSLNTAILHGPLVRGMWA